MPEPPPANPPTPGRLARSFRYAFRGVAMMVAAQSNARIHAGATVVVLGSGFILGLERWEWCALLGAIGLVWTAEAVNTAIETVVDLASPEWHTLAGGAKDIAAGAVLCAAITAAVLGALIFGPKIAAFF